MLVITTVVAGLPASDQCTIFLDPGHGGSDSGAVRIAANGNKDHLLHALADIGYIVLDRGVKEDSMLYQWRGRRGHLSVSNRQDAAILGSEAGQWAIARGYVAAVDAHFAE